MDAQPRWREAVRAVVLDQSDRILLVRFEFPPHFADPRVWAAPGGGVEAGEDDATALRRELHEELGRGDLALGPCIWTRTHPMPMPTGHDGQRERFYLVRTPSFDPRPALSDTQLRAEFLTGMRWWTPSELAAADTVFSPRSLPALVTTLLVAGPPQHPIDVGI